MPSLVEQQKQELEEQGNLVTLANASSGWFAVFQSTWFKRIATARGAGRTGPSLIVYRTQSGEPRAHYVIPYAVACDLLIEETITHSKVNGSKRWNLTLKNHQLHVTHGKGRVDVSTYFGAELPGERTDYFTPEEVEPGQEYREGAVRQIQVNAYERDRAARERCLEYYGRRCVVCRMTFAEVYGDAFESIIHVHHVVALSTIAQEYEVDPVADLRPVCPNCHAVIHSRRDQYTIKKVKELLRQAPQAAKASRPRTPPLQAQASSKRRSRRTDAE
ncbi:MAG: hypothetical protein HC897_07915 [Thermoanaerobaculia bacterium]|nr:hypothetical protein [Thermoanaerobaculia bacterium]